MKKQAVFLFALCAFFTAFFLEGMEDTIVEYTSKQINFCKKVADNFKNNPPIYDELMNEYNQEMFKANSNALMDDALRLKNVFQYDKEEELVLFNKTIDMLNETRESVLKKENKLKKILEFDTIKNIFEGEKKPLNTCRVVLMSVTNDKKTINSWNNLAMDLMKVQKGRNSLEDLMKKRIERRQDIDEVNKSLNKFTNLLSDIDKAFKKFEKN